MKKLLILFFCLFFTCLIFSQNITSNNDINFTITEKAGNIDVSVNDAKWKDVNINDVLNGNIEIMTGFHSHVTLKIGENSDITVNQLTHITIENNSITDKGTIINIALHNGYLSINSKKVKNYSTSILVNLAKGNAEFNNSTGEVFYNVEKGAIVKSIKGLVKLGAKLTKTYYITTDEVCGILPDGKLVESDYYLRREMNAKPNQIIESNDIESYYEQFFQNYTTQRRSNDYGNAFRP